MNKEKRLRKIEQKLDQSNKKRTSLDIRAFNRLADLGDPDCELTEAEKQKRLKELEPKLVGFDPTRLNKLARKYADEN